MYIFFFHFAHFSRGLNWMNSLISLSLSVCLSLFLSWMNWNFIENTCFGVLLYCLYKKHLWPGISSSWSPYYFVSGLCRDSVMSSVPLVSWYLWILFILVFTFYCCVFPPKIADPIESISRLLYAMVWSLNVLISSSYHYLWTEFITCTLVATTPYASLFTWCNLNSPFNYDFDCKWLSITII